MSQPGFPSMPLGGVFGLPPSTIPQAANASPSGQNHMANITPADQIKPIPRDKGQIKITEYGEGGEVTHAGTIQIQDRNYGEPPRGYVGMNHKVARVGGHIAGASPDSVKLSNPAYHPVMNPDAPRFLEVPSPQEQAQPMFATSPNMPAGQPMMPFANGQGQNTAAFAQMPMPQAMLAQHPLGHPVQPPMQTAAPAVANAGFSASDIMSRMLGKPTAPVAAPEPEPEYVVSIVWRDEQGTDRRHTLTLLNCQDTSTGFLVLLMDEAHAFAWPPAQSMALVIEVGKAQPIIYPVQPFSLEFTFPTKQGESLHCKLLTTTGPVSDQ